MHLPRLLLSCSLMATGVAAAAAAPEEIRLWPGVAPGSEGRSGPETVTATDGVRRIANIHQPSLSVYLPGADVATGAAVIVLPGGGHRYLSIDNEGHAVARWLSEHGVAGFVLAYRLAREPGSTYRVEEHALQDAQRAIRVVRSRAVAWRIDPRRIGILGFSAGGEVAGLAAARFDPGAAGASDPIERESSRPDFQAHVYAGARAAESEIPADAPPAFLCVAADDQGPSRTALALFQKLRDKGVDAELHVYAQGGHGFGMRDRPFPITGWPSRFHDWMRAQGLLATSRPASAP
jgi:acetyl esterase/lipase